jgi:dTDP-4-dehydrorhamnose reductase
LKIVVIGSTGQLGTDLMGIMSKEHETVGLTHQEIEVTSYDSCLILRNHDPDVVINTAAFHKTDQCEDEPERAFLINAVGSRNVASISREIGATTVFISTDYVFDGSKKEPYTEDDVPNPINTYGISKLAGEFCTKQNPKNYIVRVASLFGVAGASGKGGNFIESIMAKARKDEPITVVDDMWVSPTYTKDAASAIERLVEAKLPFGTYHVTNQGFCTWFQFAEEILKLAGQNPSLTAIKTSQLQSKARRPRFSALKNAKLEVQGIFVRGWKEALLDYLIEKNYRTK